MQPTHTSTQEATTSREWGGGGGGGETASHHNVGYKGRATELWESLCHY